MSTMAPELAEDPTVALRKLMRGDAGQEKRSFPCTYRAKKDEAAEAGWVVNGYATVFGNEYPIYGGPEMGGWNEVMMAGAVVKTLSERPDVAFLINHAGMTLARTKSGTLRLGADDHGLTVEADLDARSQTANELAVAMERKDMDEMSMAFWVLRDRWLTAEGEEVPWWDLAGIRREITEIRMHKGDVSVVNYGANDATSSEVSARTLREFRAAARLWTPEQVVEMRALLDQRGAPVAAPVVEPVVAPTAKRTLDAKTMLVLAGLPLD